ncbi:NADP-dependent oxidoreductase domain-containing protein [Mycena alexandri]|uniref:NADP-dependent oxidoreductase domain-containing protein n=1 Tax=Mycena alexandri TaxID=1745969 RepID=A0AAD6THD8_9AGAR|nr:NADP-dependent oxidoreductase domain-containing protein [Mycena alexandri]
MTLTRKIGTATFPAIGLGMMGIGAYYGATGTFEERFKVLDAALAAGCTFWDTADMYGDSEELVGKYFAARPGAREKVFLSSKFGFVLPSFEINSTPEYTKIAVESSLKKLGVDYIDCYYVHRADMKTPIEHTIAVLADFVKAGKIKYIGLSEISATTLRRAHAVHPISVIQMEYSPFTLDIEDPKLGVLPAARELGIPMVAYAPLARGLATGQFRSPDDFEETDFRRMIPRFSAENFPKVNKLQDALKAIGEKYNANVSQVTLAWLLAQGEDIIVIPGTKQVKYIEDNMAALKIKLSPDDVKAVRDAALAADAASQRYPRLHDDAHCRGHARALSRGCIC